MNDIPPGASRQSPYRESLIASILGKQFLVYGGEVCQLCGQIKTFHGWAQAMATHRYREFTCSDCLAVLGDDGAKSRLEESRDRSCEVCLRRIAVADEPGPKYLCASCRGRGERGELDRSEWAALQALSRRRNLEHRSASALETLDFNTEVAQLEQGDAEAASRALRVQFEERAAAALRERHGDDERGRP